MERAFVRSSASLIDYAQLFTISCRFNINQRANDCHSVFPLIVNSSSTIPPPPSLPYVIIRISQFREDYASLSRWCNASAGKEITISCIMQRHLILVSSWIVCLDEIPLRDIRKSALNFMKSRFDRIALPISQVFRRAKNVLEKEFRFFDE